MNLHKEYLLLVVLTFSFLNFPISFARGLSQNKNEFAFYSILSEKNVISLNSKFCWRFELRPGDCAKPSGWNDCTSSRERAELRSLVYDQFNKVHTYEFSVHLPLGSPKLQGKYIIAQWHNNYDGPSLSLRIKEDKAWLDLQLKPQQTTKAFNLPILQRGRWYFFKIQIKWSSKEDGMINLFVDGDKLISFKGQTYGSYLSEKISTGPFFKFGLYRSHLYRIKERLNIQTLFFCNRKRTVQ